VANSSLNCGGKDPYWGFINDREKYDLPNQIFSSDDACGDGITKCVKFNLLVALEVLLAQKHIEVGGFLN